MRWQITDAELRYAELIAAGKRAEADMYEALDIDAADLQLKIQQLIDDGERSAADLIEALARDEKRFARIDAAAFRVMRAIDRSSSGTTRQIARRQCITKTPISAHKILYIVTEKPCFVEFCALLGNIYPTSVSRIQPATHRGSRRITTSQDRRCRVVSGEGDR